MQNEIWWTLRFCWISYISSILKETKYAFLFLLLLLFVFLFLFGNNYRERSMYRKDRHTHKHSCFICFHAGRKGPMKEDSKSLLQEVKSRMGSVTTFDIRLQRTLRTLCSGHAGVTKENDIGGKGALISGLLLGRYKVLRSLKPHPFA